MPRVKRGKSHLKRRKNILKDTKGFRGGRKNLIKQAKVAVTKAGLHAAKDRRKKKGVNRRLWQVQLNAVLRGKYELTYSKFIALLTKHNVEINRKVLAELANTNPEVFDYIMSVITK